MEVREGRRHSISVVSLAASVDKKFWTANFIERIVPMTHRFLFFGCRRNFDTRSTLSYLLRGVQSALTARKNFGGSTAVVFSLHATLSMPKLVTFFMGRIISILMMPGG